MATTSRPPSRRPSRWIQRRNSTPPAIRKGRAAPTRKGTPRHDRPARREWIEHEFEPVQVPRWKRGADIALVLLLLPLALLLAMFVCLWIKIVSPGNVLFRQTRVGSGGRPFTIYKFRTMKPRAETTVYEAHVEELIKSNQPLLKLDLYGDSRLIKGGCTIRMSGLDELPQLMNILRGEMSLVGPRPCTPCEFPLYEPEDYLRFKVTPGLTGQWQVMRTRETTFREMVAMDLTYAAAVSPRLDLWIIMQTPGSVMRQLAGYIRHKVDPKGAAWNPERSRRTAGVMSRAHES